MVVLALETATRAGSLALWRDGAVASAVGDVRRTHAERLPADALSLLSGAGLQLADVDLFAVVSGPGSFTGLRVGIAAAQGFALASGKRVVGVPTLDAIASAWVQQNMLKYPTLVVACLDGQRGQMFYGGWEFNGDGRTAQARVDPSVGLPSELADRVRNLADLPVVVVSDDLDRLRPLLADAAQIEAIPMRLADVAVRFAASHPSDAVAPHALRPIYIRRPDAELARDRARPLTAERTVPSPTSAAALEVGRASAADLPAVAALQQRTFSNPWAAESIRWELEHTDVARLYVARTAAGDVMAYCACWMVFDELHINSLAVDDAWRRQGVARLLLSRVFDDAVREGARAATLEVRRSNEAAHALYSNLGFQVEAVRRDYYQQPREDALILWHRRLAEGRNGPGPSP